MYLFIGRPPQFFWGGGGVKIFAVVLIGVVAASLAAEDIAASVSDEDIVSYSIMVHTLAIDIEDDGLDPGYEDVKNVFQFLLIFAHNLFFVHLYFS